jgi:hypothetical protein
VYPEKPTLYDIFANSFGGNTGVRLPALGRPDETRVLGTLTAILTRFRRGEMLTLMPNVFVR